jgi:serine/threonine protein kinase
LGHGGVTTVLRAIERDSGRVVALKRLHPQFASDAWHIRQFAREARIAQSLRHPNIVHVFDVGRIEGVHYMSMEWIPGLTITALVGEGTLRSRMPVGVALWILRQLLGALDFVTRGLDESKRPFGIIHRNISPSNVIITSEGEAKVIDFGMAKSRAGRYATNSGIVKGELGYMAPEVLAGKEAETPSDIYSLAVLAWELLTSRRLFGGSELEQLAKRASHCYLPPSKLRFGISQEIDELLGVALAVDPCARWPSAAAMAGALDNVIRRYGRSYGPDAWLTWRRGQGNMLPVDVLAADATDSSDIGAMTTLSTRPAKSGRPRTGLSRKRFGPDAKTVLDPVYDPRERHRLVAANDD